VFVGLRTAEQIADAWEICTRRVAAMGVPLDGVIVAQRVRGRREFALGVRQDPLFGTVVMVSDGGKYVEALRDFVVLLYPFCEADVIARLRRLRIAPVLAGVRGEGAVDLRGGGPHGSGARRAGRGAPEGDCVDRPEPADRRRRGAGRLGRRRGDRTCRCRC
jgi:hypothetical protein